MAPARRHFAGRTRKRNGPSDRGEVCHRHGHRHAQRSRDCFYFAMQLDMNIGSAVDDLDIERVPPVDPERLDDGLFGAEACREVLFGIALPCAVLPLLIGEERLAERRIASQLLGKPLRLEEIDPDPRCCAHSGQVYETNAGKSSVDVAYCGIFRQDGRKIQQRGGLMATVGLAPTTTPEQVTMLTVELLANLLQRDAADLRRELEGNGALMPVDSLDMFDILQEFRSRTGLALPVKSLKRDTLRSIDAFANFVCNEAK